MALTFTWKRIDDQDLCCPRIVCDLCREEVIKEGTVAYRDEMVPHFFHKRCMGRWDRMYGHDDLPYTEEMDLWLCQLHNNFLGETRHYPERLR